MIVSVVLVCVVLLAGSEAAPRPGSVVDSMQRGGSGSCYMAEPLRNKGIYGHNTEWLRGVGDIQECKDRCLALPGCKSYDATLDETTCAIQDVNQNDAPLKYYSDYMYVEKVCPYECAADLAIALDVSGSIGSETVSRMSANLVSALLNQLSRLPSTTGRNEFSTNIYIIYFNSNIAKTVIKGRGQRYSSIRGDVTEALRVAGLMPTNGGTALTYAIENAGKTLLDNGSKGVASVLLTITDGKENDPNGLASSASPQEAAQLNQQDELTQMSVGIVGEGGELDSAVLSQIGVDGSYTANSMSDVNTIASQIADEIATFACSRGSSD